MVLFISINYTLAYLHARQNYGGPKIAKVENLGQYKIL